MRQVQPVPPYGFAQQTIAFQEDVRREVNRGMSYNAVSANYQTKDERFVGVDSTGGAVTITLATRDLARGKQFTIKDVGGGAGSNNITVATEGSETIDGAATQTISTNYGSLNIFSNGINWFIA